VLVGSNHTGVSNSEITYNRKCYIYVAAIIIIIIIVVVVVVVVVIVDERIV
jgi:t-SNARE complex subunit (syntaxin)